MKRLAVAMAAAAVLGSTAWAQWGPAPGGMGPGMMDGPFAAHGLGRGMMGSYGGPGMGMGAIGFGAYDVLDLTEAQRSRIAAIEEEVWRRHWALMAEAQGFGPGDYARMAAVRRQMYEVSLDARRRIEEVLTPAQRERLQQAWGCRW